MQCGRFNGRSDPTAVFSMVDCRMTYFRKSSAGRRTVVRAARLLSSGLVGSPLKSLVTNADCKPDRLGIQLSHM